MMPGYGKLKAEAAIQLWPFNPRDAGGIVVGNPPFLQAGTCN
jgi:hypothetical protein